jgi:hypothetical protein
MVAFGRQAKAGIAIHDKTKAKTSMDRHFAITRCYLSVAIQCKTSHLQHPSAPLAIEPGR